ncbi:aromatic acid exporter family protein [Clostridium mediterraneense]|uniref:aromatic acid exporter family protein n=1 Tax=Clostridium mediterraneense TaxID=1805472 RepID=UPI000A07BAF9|nr:aromatic acid exporter family protein [Clostridium mediterraneense]
MKYIYNLAVKMALSATIALIICNFLNIQYGTVSAVIAILSIQSTKRKALLVSKNRILAGVIALILSFVLYKYLGNSPVIFGVFLLIYIPITSKFKIEEGMVPAVVLSNHLLVADKLDLNLMINELLIMIIGVFVAFIANLFMPSFDQKYDEDKLYIESELKTIVAKIGNNLLTQTVDIDEQKIIYNLEKRILDCEKTAHEIVNNKLLKNNNYYIDYINMRKNQFEIIKKMRKHFEKFYMSYKQTKLISDFTLRVSENISEFNDCKILLEELDALNKSFKTMELPKTRDEFENRAQLIHFLNDLEEFLLLKRNFSKVYKDYIEK